MDRLWWVLAIAFLAAPAAAAPAPVATWFDAATARELMDARREFDAAEQRLQRRTLAALQRFFVRERAAGRITPAAYERVAGGELRANYFPSIRRRKWAGPAVTGFRQEIRTPEYRQVLAEVRKLWAAQAAGGEVVPAPGSYPPW